MNIAGIVLITLGVIGLAVLERKSHAAALTSEQTTINPKYQIGILAIIFPILYALLDFLGTATDGIYLSVLELISEDAALLAYGVIYDTRKAAILDCDLVSPVQCKITAKWPDGSALK